MDESLKQIKAIVDKQIESNTSALQSELESLTRENTQLKARKEAIKTKGEREGMASVLIRARTQDLKQQLSSMQHTIGTMKRKASAADVRR